MPVSIVSNCSDVACSWYSSVTANDGEAPSPGFPMIGSNFDAVRDDVEVLGADRDAVVLRELRRLLHHQPRRTEHFPRLLFGRGTRVHFRAVLAVGDEHVVATAAVSRRSSRSCAALRCTPGGYRRSLSRFRFQPKTFTMMNACHGSSEILLLLARPLALHVRQELDEPADLRTRLASSR
jgi:hypothetical protein